MNIVIFFGKDEPLIQINALKNQEQNRKGREEWDIQIHYCNLYITERQNIICCFPCAAIILEYKIFKNKITENLYDHYKTLNFILNQKYLIRRFKCTKV